ncbi:hypothetical protein HAX54_051819 [Datura stramonium]|uniref:Late embryogenesis abundant protein n=1 Tax=Datura stramonium TaxID=4076 RepID=A0ABS8RRE3_DATST|nr:hypothetical protein [Datura stramonium]
MQAIKEKFSDMSTMRKAKAEAKAEEKAEKELAKVRVEVAHEVRLAREAEAAMDMHVNKAAEKIAREEEKHIHESAGTLDPYAAGFTNTNNPTGGGDHYANHPGQLNNAGTGPTNNLL